MHVFVALQGITSKHAPQQAAFTGGGKEYMKVSQLCRAPTHTLLIAARSTLHDANLRSRRSLRPKVRVWGTPRALSQSLAASFSSSEEAGLYLCTKKRFGGNGN